MADTTNAKIKRLVRELRTADESYYNLGEPYLSDEEYDAKRALLKKLDPSNPYLLTVGCKPHGTEVRLPVRMLSLEKKRPSEIEDWIAKAPDVDFWDVLPKMDGLSGMLHYRNGRLIAAYRRGDSTVGSDVTIHAPHVHGVPTRLREYGDAMNYPFWRNRDVFVQGEFCMSWPDFESIPPEVRGKHPRNLCVGLLNRKEPDPDLLSKMRFVAFRVSIKDDSGVIRPPRDLHRVALYLSSWRFITVWNHSRLHILREKNLKKTVGPYQKLGAGSCKRIWAKDIDSTDWASVMNEVMLGCDIPTDGVVLVPSDSKLWRKINSSGTAPKWSVAIKPERHQQKSLVGVVDHIEWDISGRRLLKPTGVLKEPLIFDGVSVTRFTCNNAATVEDWGIGPGAKVEIIRSGDVIPFVLSVPKKVTPKLPGRCPSCNTKLRWNKTEVDLVCPNESCGGADLRRLSQFVSRMKIDWIASGTVEKMYQKGITSIPKLLKIKEADLLKLPGFAGPSARKAYLQIQSCLKGVPLHRLMYASGCFHNETMSLGETRLKKLIKMVGRDRVTVASISEIRKKLGAKMTASETGRVFLAGIEDFQNLYMNHMARRHTEPVLSKTKVNLENEVIVFSGWRDEKVVDIIEAAGGRYSNSLVKDATLLVTDDPSSKKSNEAAKRGIPVMSVSEFRSKIGA